MLVNLILTKLNTRIVFPCALFLLLCLSLSTVSISPANAELINSKAYLSVQPTTIGLGQEFLVNAWIAPVPLFDATGNSILYENFMFAITAPDGKVANLAGITSEPSGTTWFTYPAAQLGTYKIVFSWAGDDSHTAATSPASYVTVQTAQVQIGAPPVQMPTGYWDRPINAQNREWWNIAGDWLSTSWCQYNGADDCYNPYSLAPNSAHIIWEKTVAVGGMVGGTKGDLYSSGSAEAIIIFGRAVYSSGGLIHCVDVHSGEEFWAVTGSGTLLGAYSADQGGTTATGTATGQSSLAPSVWALGTSTWTQYNLLTGATSKTLTGIGSPYSSIYASIDVSSRTEGPFVYLCAHDGVATTQNLKVDLGKSGSTVKALVVWNNTVVNKYLPHHPTVSDGVFVAMSQAPFQYAYNVTTGKMLYNVTRDPQGETRGSIGYDKVYVQVEGGGLNAFNLFTGQLVWSKNPTQYPWGAFTTYALGIAYGNVYEATYDGHVYAYNAETGETNWAFFVGNTTWTPYGTFPFYGKPAVADGKVYVSTTEHSPSQPFIEGFRMYCLDAIKGNLLWSISGSYGSSSIGDGILVTSNQYDGTMYAFGRGQTAVTVSAPQVGVQVGTPMLISGTVLDQSASQPNTPAISDESMSDWMQYLHMQYPMPTNATGVPVKVTAIDPNNNYQDLGTAISDTKGNFFVSWTPPISGIYKVTATFAGSNSYYSSDAGTAFVVAAKASPAILPTQTPIVTPNLKPTSPISSLPSPTQAVEPKGGLPTLTYVAIATAVIIILISVAAIALRKRK